MWLLAPGTVAAQSIGAGALAGTVVDRTDGRPIAGALVTLTGVESGTVRAADAAGDGSFRFPFLPPGTYRLRVEDIGYRPAIVNRVQVGPGSEARLTVGLNPQSPPVSTIDTLPDLGSVGGAAPGAGQALTGPGLSRFPLPGLGGGELLALSSQIEPPVGAVALAVDGVIHPAVQHPHRREPDLAGLSVSRGALDRLELLTAPVDIEWMDQSDYWLSGTTRSGTRGFEGRGFVDWSGGALSASEYFDPSTASANSYRGGFRLSGPLVRDSAYFIVGGEGGRIEQPRSRLWEPRAADSALVALARDSFGIALDQLLQPWKQRDDRASAFTRVDWQLGPRHRVSVSGNFGHLQRTGSSGLPWGPASVDAGLEATDVTARATVTSMLSSVVTNEIRAGFELSRLRYEAGDLPFTYFGAGLGFGADPQHAGTFERTGLVLEDALHVVAGNHGVKLGVAARLATQEQTHGFAVTPVFFFSDVDGWGTRRGSFLGSVSQAPVARFSTPAVGAFLQDRWSLGPGFDLIAALRYDLDVLRPRNAPNQAWLDLTGLDNTLVPGTVGKLSSRLGFTWRVDGDRWLIRGGAGTYYEAADPATMAELIAESGGVEVQRGIGALGSWPALPDAAAAPAVGDRLTLLGPEFEPPRSTKATFGLSRGFGAGGSFSLAVAYSHTDFQLRRHDLNRLAGGTGTDQYGRQVYGTLVKEGGLLAAQPGSNRRFAGFELVSALDPDGFTDYWGVTVRLDQPVGRFLRLLADYTYSETVDNWLRAGGNGPYGQLSPFPDSLNGRDWAEGRSDFDLPHRAVIAAELLPLGRGGFSIAAVYRVQSGRPFTPGFRLGVDANGDGSWSNDPAYIDDALPGMDALFAAFPCLRVQTGRFAGRNSCREPRQETLHLRIGVGPVRANLPVEAWVEILNLTDADFPVYDHALLLVDPAAPLTLDPSSGNVSVPLIANSDFGGILARRAPGRSVRLGLRVNY